MAVDVLKRETHKYSARPVELDYESLFSKRVPAQLEWIDDSHTYVIKSSHKGLHVSDSLWKTTAYTLDFQILDREFSLNYRFKNLHEEILSSMKFLNYSDDWDDENAVGCDSKIFLRTIELLVAYAEYVYKFYDIVIKTPEISLVRDGSFDIEWRTKNRTLLMNIVNSDSFDVHFYGKDTNTTVLKGFLINIDINRELAHWMQRLI